MSTSTTRSPVLFLLIALAACGGSSTGPDSDAPPILTELPRTLSGAELHLVEGGNAFTLDLVREAARDLAPDSNLILSPLSASMALGMALNGATGETWSAMRGALRLEGVEEPAINQGYRDLMALLRGLDPRTEMRIANSMWASQAISLKLAFIDAGRTFFDAEVATLDFLHPAAVERINGWVDRATNGRIPDLVQGISPDDVLILINAIYFKGAWRTQFDPRDTRDGSFRAADGTTRTVPLMQLEDDLHYAEGESYQAVDLLYGNGAFAMTVLLPRGERTATELAAGLSAEDWRELTRRFARTQMSLTLPRFRAEYSRRLIDDLTAMGMGIAFTFDADFSRIAPDGDRLYISGVNQKTFIEVNEEGTEAAAATSVVFTRETAVPVEMRVDRPFVFAIRERLSGTILFLGVMNVVES